MAELTATPAHPFPADLPPVLAAALRARILPVLVVDDPDRAVPLADALLQGGIGAAEITLRTPAALEAIRRISANRDVVVGAGTVINADQVEAAAHAGARFIVSPGLSRSVVQRAQELAIPVIPGVATASEVMQALDLGLSLLKFFPAATCGGAPAVKALAGPFPQVRFVPTGGIGPDDADHYLSLPTVLAVGGSWLAPATLLAAGDYPGITTRARAAAAAAQGVPS